MIDPGPNLDDHLDAILAEVADAEEVTLLLTHDHPDHAALAARLRRETGGRILGSGSVVERTLSDGEGVETDDGSLRAVRTPGHTPDHLAFLWPEAGAVFVGDLMLGTGTTTWVAGYERAVADYLGSLDRIRSLGAERLYPTHGPPIDDVVARIDLFERHRRDRIEQVRRALERSGPQSAEQLLEPVYGASLPSEYRQAAVESLTAILDYLAHSTD